MTAALSPEEVSEYDAETVLLVEKAETACIEADAEAESLKSQYTSAKKLAEHATNKLRALIRERREGRGKRPDLTLIDMLPKPTAWRDKHPAHIKDKLDAATYAVVSAATATLGELWHQVTGFNPAEGTPYGLGLVQVAAVRNAIQGVIDREAGDIAEAAQPPAELWREYPMERWQLLGLTLKDVERLAAGESKTETGRFPITTVGNLADYSTPSASGWQRRLSDIKGFGSAAVERMEAAETQFWAWWRDGGEAEYAAERGLGNENPAGPGSGDDSSGGDGDTEIPSAEWLESRPIISARPEVPELQDAR